MKNKNRNINHSRSCGPQDSGISTLLKDKAAGTPDYKSRGWINAFTLIELLVVVLIIGVLAAVAVPQYQKAVEKSKATQALTLLKTLGKAADIYYLEKGQTPTKFEQLDISLPADWTGTEKIYNVDTTDARSIGEWSIIIVN